MESTKPNKTTKSSIVDGIKTTVITRITIEANGDSEVIENIITGPMDHPDYDKWVYGSLPVP